MTRLLYTLLFPLAFLAILPRYLARMVRRGGFRRDFGQRFGRYDPDLRERFRHGEWFWVHAVSVGELLIALKLLAELHRRHPAWRFVVSSTTSTAHDLARQKQQDWWVPVYTPVDFGPVVRHAFAAVRPRAVILTESEMWPAFIWSAAARDLPVLLINARVSPRSARRYHRFAPLLRTVTRHLAGVGLQESAHAGLWSHLGVAREHLHLTGSVKYDPDAAEGATRDFRPVLDAFGFAPGDPVLLAGSTHHGEEEILARALAELRGEFPAARLVIAPRHVERTADIVARLTETGLRIARRTAPPDGPAPDILLLDTTGELRDWYACADIVFIGKSLTGHGGQNPAEAILAGRPVLFGPHMENFATLRDALLADGGAVEVHAAASLAAAAADLLRAPARCADMARHAADTLRPHQGATVRTADLVDKLCHDSPARAV
ncbi:MAG: glycosyltransferase N-terminal domain-containing protein [Chthoniobacterales bacterium]